MFIGNHSQENRGKNNHDKHQQNGDIHKVGQCWFLSNEFLDVLFNSLS